MSGKEGRKVYRDPRWGRARRKVLDRAGYRCERCGRAGTLEVHHRQPIAAGGAPFALSNLEAICRPCHWEEHHPIPADVQAWEAHVGG